MPPIPSGLFTCRPRCRPAKRAIRTAFSNIRRRRSRTFALAVLRRSFAKRSTWAPVRWSSSAGTRRRLPSGSASSARAGIVYTRTGRRFFADQPLETELTRADACGDGGERLLVAVRHRLGLHRLRADALVGEGPGTVAVAVRRRGRRRSSGIAEGVEALRQTADRLETEDDADSSTYSSDAAELLERFQNRDRAVEKFVDAYRHYCWPVASLDDLKLAPFHLLATEGKVHADQNHVWHMETLASICRHDPGLLLETPFQIVDLDRDRGQGEESGAEWWLELTGGAAKGWSSSRMSSSSADQKGLVQPAVKCRGREYLRIIYGPEYTLLRKPDTLAAAWLGHEAVAGDSRVLAGDRGP